MAFIKQEAVEKAREIQIKADEEFAIEKAKIVRQKPSTSIRSTTRRSSRQRLPIRCKWTTSTAMLDQRLFSRLTCFTLSSRLVSYQPSAQSNQTNKSRLKILQTREQHLQSLFDATREKLDGIARIRKSTRSS